MVTLFGEKPSSLNGALRSTPSISKFNLRSNTLKAPADSSLLTLNGEEISSWFLKEKLALQGEPRRIEAFVLVMVDLEKLKSSDVESAFTNLMKHSGRTLELYTSRRSGYQKWSA